MTSKRTKILEGVLCILIVGGISVVAEGDDLYPPAWRGNNGTTYAEFDAWIEVGIGPSAWYSDSWTAVPDEIIIQPQVVLASPSTGVVHSTYEGRSDVLEFPSNESPLRLCVFNFDWNNPVKHMRLQITYHPGGSAPSQLTLLTSGTMSSVVTSTESLGDNWNFTMFDFDIEPNPSSEFIDIEFDDSANSGFVDQLVIDTYCVPEPATLLLLTLGTATLVRRKPRRI